MTDQTKIERILRMMKMLTTNASWFGVTYREDREKTVNTLQELTDKGEYPNKLFA